MFQTEFFKLACLFVAAMTWQTAWGEDSPRKGKQPADPAALFQRLDADGDGKLSSDELPDQRREMMLKNLDTDGDQSISHAEFEAGATGLARKAGERGPGGQLRPGQSDQRRGTGGGPLTAALDTDGDGELSPDEIAAAAESLKKLDRDGDGRVDRRELAAASPTQNDSAAPRRTNAESLLGRVLAADKDGDGKISLEEAPERLKNAFDRMDTNSDGLLDEGELRARFDKARNKVQAKPAKSKKGNIRGKKQRPLPEQPV